MKRTTDSRHSADTLPAFLDDREAADASHSDANLEVSDAAEATAGPEALEPAAVDATAEAAEPTPAVAAAASSAPATLAAASRRSKHTEPSATVPGGGGFTAMLGTLGLGVGLSLPLWPANLAASMAAQGFGAATFVIGGLVLLATAGQLRRASALQRAVLQESQQRREQLRAVQATLLELESNHHAAKLPAVGEEMQHALLALQRQDEKVNNLTKAIKMYGKPLMEIASQGQDLAGSLAQVKTLVEGGSESTRQAVVRLETQLRNQAPAGKELTELNQQVGKLAGRIEALATKAEPPSLAPLQQQLGRLEVAIAAVAQRLEDSELRKGVLRLEATAQQSRELLQEVLRGEPVQKASSDLAQRLDGAVRGLQDGLARLRDGNLGGLETAVRDIQREVSGVATSVAQIHVAVKNGVRVATTAAVPPPAAATPAAAPTAAPTPAAAPAAASAPTAAAPTADGGGYQTGSRATPSKNVLGAIAKLKQMKG